MSEFSAAKSRLLYLRLAIFGTLSTLWDQLCSVVSQKLKALREEDAHAVLVSGHRQVFSNPTPSVAEHEREAHRKWHRSIEVKRIDADYRIS